MIESGEKFGKYTLLKKLAAGGMAEIFKARVGGLDGFEKIVAIKRLHRQFSEDEDFATMLSDEAKLAVQLSHANIGEVFDLGCIEGQYFIVMEFIDGLDLHDLSHQIQSQNRQLPLQAVVHTVTRVAGALHYAHTKEAVDGKPLEVVHRDVSPQNIMVSIDGQVKLVDFGIAKARMRAEHTRAGIIKGKFYYMSPEQAHGSRIDARTDVYALGMVLYEVLTGAHPFEQIADGDLLRSVRMARYPSVREALPDLPEQMKAIMERALMRDVNRRFQSALELKRALEDFADTSLPRFERMEMAELVRSYTGKHLPEETRAADFDAMASGEYAANEHSVIFDAAAASRQDASRQETDDFEDDETRVFHRDDDDDDEFDEFESDGETHLLDWTSDDLGASDDDNAKNAKEVGVAAGLQEAEIEDAAGAPRQKRDKIGVDFGVDSGVDNEARDSTDRMSMRLATGLVTQVDHLFRRRPHIIGAVMAGLAVVLLALSAWVVWGPDDSNRGDGEQWHAGIEDQQANPSRETEIELSVTTRPANADVFIDDRFQGKTPEVLGALEVGRGVVLRFERDGYESKELNVVVEANMTPLVVRLEPLGGILRIETEPEGADIYVQGNPQGPAPVTVMGLERELSHEIEARHSDDDIKSRTVTWSEGDERIRELYFEFAVEDEPVQVEATSAPASRRRTRPSTPRPRPQPSAQPTQETEEEESSPSGGGLDIWGAGDEDQQGRLNVRANADDGRIYVNGNMVKDDTVLVGHRLDPGRYEVQVFFPDLNQYSETTTVDVRSGETSTVMISP